MNVGLVPHQHLVSSCSKSPHVWSVPMSDKLSKRNFHFLGIGALLPEFHVCPLCCASYLLPATLGSFPLAYPFQVCYYHLNYYGGNFNYWDQTFGVPHRYPLPHNHHYYRISPSVISNTYVSFLFFSIIKCYDAI